MDPMQARCHLDHYASVGSRGWLVLSQKGYYNNALPQWVQLPSFGVTRFFRCSGVHWIPPFFFLFFSRQGGGVSAGIDRGAEEERRRASERERNNSYKDFQGKVEKETEKVQ